MDAPFTNLMDGIHVWAFAQLLNHAQGTRDDKASTPTPLDANRINRVAF